MNYGLVKEVSLFVHDFITVRMWPCANQVSVENIVICLILLNQKLQKGASIL